MFFLSLLGDALEKGSHVVRTPEQPFELCHSLLPSGSSGLADPAARKLNGRAGRAHCLELGGPGFKSWLQPSYLMLMLTCVAALGMCVTVPGAQ